MSTGNPVITHDLLLLVQWNSTRLHAVAALIVRSADWFLNTRAASVLLRMLIGDYTHALRSQATMPQGVARGEAPV
jgi:hypothetical protein